VPLCLYYPHGHFHQEEAQLDNGPDQVEEFSFTQPKEFYLDGIPDIDSALK